MRCLTVIVTSTQLSQYYTFIHDSLNMNNTKAIHTYCLISLLAIRTIEIKTLIRQKKCFCLSLILVLSQLRKRLNRK